MSLQLKTAEALSSYNSVIAERHSLKAADERRKLEARIAYLEPLYDELRNEYLAGCKHVEGLEDSLKKKEAAMKLAAAEAKKAETQAKKVVKHAQNEAQSLKGRIKALEVCSTGMVECVAWADVAAPT